MTNLFIAYITITILGILAVSLLGSPGKRKGLLEERAVINCPVCTYRYIVDGGEKIHRCPQCNSLNKT